MVVGYAEVGKTSTIDCLFPFAGWMKWKQGEKPPKELWFQMTGKFLRGFTSPQMDRKEVEIILEKSKWFVEERKVIQNE